MTDKMKHVLCTGCPTGGARKTLVKDLCAYSKVKNNQ